MADQPESIPTYQHALPEMPSKQQATDRLFFAIMPDASAAMKIAALARRLQHEDGLQGNLIDMAQLHISLFPLGQYTGLSDHIVHQAHCIAERIVLESFKVRFDVVKGFRHRSRISHQYPFVLCEGKPGSDLDNLYQGFAGFFRAQHINVPKAMTPHVTLLYSDKLASEKTVDAIEWQVEEFVLLQRHIGQNRPYSILGKWSLY